MDMNPFRTLVRTEGVRLYRDLPWRRTRDPYEIWLSEVMLQQTQVARVETRWVEWLDRFPSVFALAEAGTAEVLAAWQGMGYNRRALALKAAAEQIAFDCDGVFPTEVKELVALPGIGPATAQGIRAFAFDLPGVYLETNVRTVVLHHLFPDVPSVPDKELVPIVEATCRRGWIRSKHRSTSMAGPWVLTPFLRTKTIRPVLGITRCSITVRTSKRPFPTPLDALRRIRASRSSRGPVVRNALRSCACFSRRVNSGRGWMPRPCTRRFAPPSAMQAELRWSVSWSSPFSRIWNARGSAVKTKGFGASPD